MITPIHKARFLVFVSFSLLIVSCGGGGGGGGSSIGSPTTDVGTVTTVDTGTVTLLATDADTDEFKAINLTIIKAELFSDDGRETLFSGEKEFDLLQLAEVTEVFSVTEVPSGTYSKIRLTLTQIELVFDDDRDPAYPKLPGNGKLDLNPRGQFYVDGDNPLAIQLDFDAVKSIHVVQTGNGASKYNFRPVVFIKVVESEFDTKLIRQRGTINNLDKATGDFDLCLIEAEIQPLSHDDENDSPDCVRVNAFDVPASIFDVHADPISFEDLKNSDIATVVGRFHFGSHTVSPSSASNGNGNNGNGNGNGNGKNTSSHDDHDDFSDDDDFPDDDEFSDDDRHNMVLIAELIWTGNDINQSDNVACSNVTTDNDRGTWYRNLELPLPEDMDCQNLVTRATILQPGSKIYDSKGNAVDNASIVEGTLNTVDGYTDTDAMGDLKAVMVMLGLDDALNRPDQLTGIIGDIEAGSGLILATDEGDRCVNFDDSNTEVFETSQDEDGNVSFSQMNTSNLRSDQKANAFGTQNNEGCLDADTIIYESMDAVIQAI